LNSREINHILNWKTGAEPMVSEETMPEPARRVLYERKSQRKKSVDAPAFGGVVK
jgi:hypothetical protein